MKIDWSFKFDMLNVLMGSLMVSAGSFGWNVCMIIRDVCANEWFWALMSIVINCFAVIGMYVGRKAIRKEIELRSLLRARLIVNEFMQQHGQEIINYASGSKAVQ